MALDGTKVRASASRHKAMSYERMCSSEEQLSAEVEALLAEAERVDAREDGLYGKESRGDELPEELQRREGRLAKIRAARQALEREAKERAELAAEEARERLREREAKEAKRGKKLGGRPPRVPDPEAARPGPPEQKNFTDPESRIMVDGATRSFVQAYNAQAAVDAGSQVIVAASLTQEANDKRQLRPLLAQIAAGLGALPHKVSADSGFFSADNLTDPALAEVELYVPPEKRVQRCAVAQAMREKLAGKEGRAVYARRKAVVEPVFGQVKEGRGFRRFSLRGRAGQRGMAAHLPDAQPAQAAPFGSLATPRLRGQEQRRFGGLQAPLARGALQRTGAADPAVSAQGDPLLLMLRHPARAFHDMIARQAPRAPAT